MTASYHYQEKPTYFVLMKEKKLKHKLSQFVPKLF